jgi:hypothetical protein
MQWRTHRRWKRRGGAGLARLWGRRGAQDSRAGARPGRCCRPRRANTSDPPCAYGGPAQRVRRPPAGARARPPAARCACEQECKRPSPGPSGARTPRAHQVAPRARRDGEGGGGGVPPRDPPQGCEAQAATPERARRARSSHSRPVVRVRRNAPFRRPRCTVLRWLCRARPSARICQHRASVSDVNMRCPKRQARSVDFR